MPEERIPHHGLWGNALPCHADDHWSRIEFANRKIGGI
jgi:hypothetical protein